MIDIDYDRN
ncbi:unnamed protein product, partial [Rotaria magnacalcarata]